MTPRLLFAYGTLMPRDAAAEAREGWRPDAVRGRLFDLGPYPALVDLDAGEADWVEGFVREVTLGELTGRLDPYEGVDEGLYVRVPATTRAGRLAWVYAWSGPVPHGARGPLTRWRVSRATPAVDRDPDDSSSSQETTDGDLSRSGIGP
jgi:gamma-glutamylcyclotransferase (GGCT)/AIG2-like uncharacterized protein YtfP